MHSHWLILYTGNMANDNLAIGLYLFSRRDL
nr:MAG TPA: hypothetical protein [Caudoviricetes sp.]